MTSTFIKTAAVVTSLMAGTAVFAEQFVVELAGPLTVEDPRLMQSLNVSQVERFDTAGKSYIVFEAQDEAALGRFLDARAISPLKIKEVGFVNSPEVGGGTKAGFTALPGQQTYVIERPVSGIGDLPIETQQQLSMKSNAALTQMGDGIEWVHSYLTDEGTYCVYRAVDTDKIVEHGEISEFPISNIAAVVPAKAGGE